MKRLIVIAGPTASGKTALAIQLAHAYNTEIISCDSRQFFKELEIGTAKPSEEELSQVKHHFIDSHSIHQEFSAGDFEREGLKLINELFKRYDTIVMVGGSGLYVRALCHGLDEFPKVDVSYRDQLNIEFEKNGIQVLQEELKLKDPDYYKIIDPENSQRVIRALEVCRATGKPVSSFFGKNDSKRNFEILKIGVELPRDVLYNRINTRVDIMVAAGLIDECKKLEPLKNLNALQTVGYKEFFDAFEGEHTIDEAIELVKRNTRRYAKRQITWFNKEPGLKWLDVSNFDLVLEFIEGGY